MTAESEHLPFGVHGVSADLHHDPLGPAVVSFRDPDNIQLEFFEQV